MVNSCVAKPNEEGSGASVKMMRSYVRDVGLAVAFGHSFYSLCRHVSEPDECGLPLEFDVIRVSPGNNKILVNPVFKVLL